MNIFHGLSVIVLWILIWEHAFEMDITHDEAYSFYLIKINYYRAMPGSANTHWLNSFFMKLFDMIFGDGPGFLRIHSVLAFPFFAHAIFRLSSLIKSKPLQLLFYCIIVFNPYLLDFFSLARGYGLALTFQAWTLLLLAKACSKAFDFRAWFNIVILTALTAAANLSYFYSIAATFLIFILFLITDKENSKKKRVIAILFCLIILFTIADLLFIRYKGKDLGYGGDYDFLQSVVGSVWDGSLYFSLSHSWSSILSYLSFTLVLFAAAFYFFKLIKEKKLSAGFIMSVPIVILIVLSLLFHEVLNIPFLYGRTALQWWIPAMFIICCSFSEWTYPIKQLQFASYSLSGIICILITFHFAWQFNSRYCFEWHAQANSRQALIDLYELHPMHPKINPVLRGVYNNYYAVTNPPYILKNVEVLKESENTACDEAFKQSLINSDYILSYFPGTIDCLEKEHIKYHIIKAYSWSQNKLIKIDQ